MIEKKLKLCPHCGSTNDLSCAMDDTFSYRVYCHNCRMRGPMFRMNIDNPEQQAIEAWNSLPRGGWVRVEGSGERPLPGDTVAMFYRIPYHADKITLGFYNTLSKCFCDIDGNLYKIITPPQED